MPDVRHQPFREPPERAWKALKAVAICLFAAAVLIAGPILGGVFDPKPFGSAARLDHPGPVDLTDSGERTIDQQPPWPLDSPPDRFSVRLTAAYSEGDADSGYGLAVGDGSHRLVVAVSPLGYAAVREESNEGEPEYPLPWQPWPHVHTGLEENEIWLDIDNRSGRAALTARVNRELLWQGEIEWPPERVVLWLAGFNGGTSVDFQALEWFAGSNGLSMVR